MILPLALEMARLTTCSDPYGVETFAKVSARGGFSGAAKSAAERTVGARHGL